MPRHGHSPIPHFLGTNTYLNGKGPRKVLLDTGEGIPEYIPLLQTALDKELQGATISRVICSHWHRDHVGGIQDVVQFLSSRNIHLNPSPLPTTTTPQAAAAAAATSHDAQSLLGIHKFPCPEHDDEETLFQPIQDQQEIQVDDQTTLVTLHTPGHTTDHCTFYLKEENTLFTADCVLGQGTAVFEDLSEYIQSLERLLTVGQGQQQQPPTYKIYPGHGPVIEDGPSKIREYIKHRLEREKQILGVLTANNSHSTTDATATTTTTTTTTTNDQQGAGKTAMQIVEIIYEAYPKNIYPAAEHQVLLHLFKLEQDGKVKRTTRDEDVVDVWVPVQSAQASL
ncbi:hypothetical protein BGX31_011227 [Mortierella sp. GBA43]|nr:hypothetical protein BGX31_011227 [Mortierella sp. GBA43]